MAGAKAEALPTRAATRATLLYRTEHKEERKR